jgi:hypothetical protein
MEKTKKGLWNMPSITNTVIRIWYTVPNHQHRIIGPFEEKRTGFVMKEQPQTQIRNNEWLTVSGNLFGPELQLGYILAEKYWTTKIVYR